MIPPAFGFVTKSRLRRFVIPRCPHCHKKHVHGVADDDWLRYAHCHDGQLRSYQLVPCENRAEAVRRAREAAEGGPTP
jgi:hypothetical protein